MILCLLRRSVPVALFTLLAACGGGGGGGASGGGARPPGPASTLQGLVVTAANSQVEVGAADPIYVTALFTDGSQRDVTRAATWSTSDSKIISVSTTSGGVTVSGGTAGTATLSASYQGYSGSLTLSVAAAATPALLPLEVFGGAGSSRVLDVSIPAATGIVRLYIQCHGCGYQNNALDSNAGMNKASLILPGGRTVRLKYYSGGRLSGNDRGVTASHKADVRDPSVTLMEPELTYGGIGGGFRTVRMYVALQPGDLVVGNNQFRFEYTNPDDSSVGFRIIDFNLIDSQGAAVLAPGSLGFDDPTKWNAPATSSASSNDVAAGEALWKQTNILTDPYFSTLARTAPGTPIHAACGDCHTSDGRDLHYFQYSNAAIIARSVFHGLTAVQGAQIASYIRQLNVPAPSTARPWNPPYQPGPGMDARPVSEWAAGAGISAVLNDDSEMKSYLFPNGTSTAAIANVVNRFGTLNMRELPVAIQFPDWNAWLPRIHPKDAFNANVLAVRSPYGASPPNNKANPDTGTYYTEVAYAALKSLPKSAMTAGVDSFINSIDTWVASGATCYTQSETNGPPFRALNSDVFMQGLTFGSLPSVSTPTDCANNRYNLATTSAIEIAKRGLAAWMSVKQWEIMSANELETASQGRAVISIGKAGTPITKVDPSEQFGWGQTLGAGDGGVFFRTAHFSSYNSSFFQDVDPLVSHYETTAWYQLQLVLNPGYRTSMPNHFPYTLLFITTIGTDTLIANPSQPRYDSFRYWASIIKMRQLQTNGYYGQEVGLDLRTAQPFFYYSDQQGNTYVPAGVDAPGTAPTLWKPLVQSLIADLIADASNATQADWANATQNSVVQSSNIAYAPLSQFTQCDGCFPGTQHVPDSPPPFTSPGATQGTNTLRLIPRLISEVQMDPAAVDSLINWCDGMWPQAAALFGAFKQ